MTCPKCKGSHVEHRTWESIDGAYEDHRFECHECGHVWWVDGPDA